MSNPNLATALQTLSAIDEQYQRQISTFYQSNPKFRDAIQTVVDEDGESFYVDHIESVLRKGDNYVVRLSDGETNFPFILTFDAQGELIDTETTW